MVQQLEEVQAVKAITLDSVLSSNKYIKENGGVQYGTPNEYLEPYINIVESLKGNFHIRVADQKSVGSIEDGSTDILPSYGRVCLETRIALDNDHYTTLGIVYALTTQVPIIKIYTGETVSSCINLCIFNADQIFQTTITGNVKSVYKQLQEYVNNLEQQNKKFFETRERMNNTLYTRPEYNEKLGEILNKSFGSILGTSPVINGAKLINKSERYSFKGDTISQWDFANAITDSLKGDYSLEKIPNKTSELFKLFL